MPAGGERCPAHIKTLHLHLTAQCLYRCPFCSADAGQRTQADLGGGDVRRLIDQMAVLEMERLDVSGGDPLLVGEDKVLGLVSYASERGIETAIATNGSRLSREYAISLKSAGLERIKLSLYGIRANTHDSFTEIAGSFDSTIRAIGYSKEAGLEVWVNAVVMPQNLQEMLYMPSLLDPLGVNLVQISSAVPAGRGEQAARYRFSEQYLSQAIKRIENSIFGDNYEKPGSASYIFTITMFPDPNETPFDGRFCNNVVERLVIDRNGDVIACCLLPTELRHVLGNIKQMALSEICQAEKMRGDIVFSALMDGHVRLKQSLGYNGSSHNLCAACADMLWRVERRHSESKEA